jgi:hypothetical protein
MKVTADNYEQMRQWFAIVFEASREGQNVPADVHPINVLDALAIRTPARARAGLSMAIGDILEMADAWRPETVGTVDRKLNGLALPTLSAMRLEFSKRIGGIVKRGRIRNEAEYYLARNAADMAGMPEHEIWKVIAVYEEGVA